MTPVDLDNQSLEDSRHTLAERCADLGMRLIRLDLDGATEDQGLEIIAAELAPLAARWNDEPSPEVVELSIGVWAAPIPETHRRRRVAYLVALAPSKPVESGSPLAALLEDPALGDHPAASRDPIGVSGAQRLMRVLEWTHCDRCEIASGQDELAGFSTQLTEAYEEISLLYKLGRSMNELVHPTKFVRLLCDELHETLAFRWVAARFVNDPHLVRQLAGRTIHAGDFNGRSSERLALIDRLVECVDSPAPRILDSNGEPADPISRSTLVLFPLMRDERLMGVIVAGDKHGADPAVSTVDIKLIEGAASSLLILMENSALYDDQQSMFLGTLEALSSAIDAKDRYTCGHSERVSRLAVKLATAIGMTTDEIERVRISGILHDVGKIGVPESVLCKPGRLTDSEFDLIKQHPAIGYRILKDIPQLTDVLDGVLHHHERWDGRGYPHGLAGQGIPFRARILALADSFDAMSSTRTYRAAMTRDKVLSEIRSCAGAQFDPELAPMFAALDFEEYDQMIARHLERERADGSRERAA